MSTLEDSPSPAPEREAPTTFLSFEFASPSAIIAELSRTHGRQPIRAILAAEKQREALAEPLLQAVERGLADQETSFREEGMLFNFATLLLAFWRETRAFPLFLRWFSLPGEGALELGGDSISQAGGRLLASVSGGQTDALRALASDRAANVQCRGQAIVALGVLGAWRERPLEQLHADLLHLAKEGLERERHPIWNYLAMVCFATEAKPVVAELREAWQNGYIDPEVFPETALGQLENAPEGALLDSFAQRHPRITSVVQETRWWAGFLEPRSTPAPAESAQERTVGQPGATYVAPDKVGRNDPCPCGSGKKYKKCCGKE